MGGMELLARQGVFCKIFCDLSLGAS